MRSGRTVRPPTARTQISSRPLSNTLAASARPSGARLTAVNGRTQSGSIDSRFPSRSIQTSSRSSVPRVPYTIVPMSETARSAIPFRSTPTPLPRGIVGPVISNRSSSNGTPSSVPSAVTTTRKSGETARATIPFRSGLYDPSARLATAMSMVAGSYSRSLEMVNRTPRPRGRS